VRVGVGVPQCAAKVATRRAHELSKVMRAVDEAGGSAFLLTLTMRHSRGDRLGLTKLERTRLRHLEENRSRYEAANAKRDACNARIQDLLDEEA
jgi:hypothetical protein